MAHALALAALGTLFTFLMTALGAATVFLLRRRSMGARAQNLFLGFAAGVMTAASVWSLLLPALALAADGPLPAWGTASLGVALGTLFLALLDARLPAVRSIAARGEAWRQNTLLAAAITLHNIPEGMAVGLAFALAADGEGLAAAWALAFGIGVQNFPEGAAISLPLHELGETRGRSFLLGTLSGAVEPLFGVLVVLAAAGVRALMPWLLSFAAGAMLYVVIEELVPLAHSRAGTLGFLAGFLVMMALDTALA